MNEIFSPASLKGDGVKVLKAAGDKAVDDARAALSGMTDPRAMLVVVRQCSRQLDRAKQGKHIDRLADIATDMFDLAPDAVTSAIAEGQEHRLDDLAEAQREARPHTNGKGAHLAEVLPLVRLNRVNAGVDPGRIPPRGWLMANQFCRRFLSSLFAPGGTGKTALRTLQYLALATGRPLTGQHVFRRCRVLLLSFEDDIDELQRRITAALIYHNIDRAELNGWLELSAPKGLKIAEAAKNGTLQAGPLARTLRAEIEDFRPDVIGLDPFLKLHGLAENDNGAMDYVCDLLVQLAIEHDLSVDAPHHTRKGLLTAGDADQGRGASSIKDAARLVSTLTTMSEEEAQTFGIGVADRRQYVRLDPAKVNIVPGTQTATWFRLVGVPLGNGTPEYPNGDVVQTVETWTPPDTWGDVPVAILNVILSEIDRGLDNGQRYSNNSTAKERAAWKVVERHCPGKPEGQCRKMITTWISTGVLLEEPYDDPIRRDKAIGLRVNATKLPGAAC
jgi:hypothetical protein